MAILSNELSQVIKDIDNAREAINEKYKINGSPEPIESPMKSSEMAEKIRAITCLGEVPEQDGNITLSVNEKQKELPGGYYKNGVKAFLKDYVIGYVWNRQGCEAKRQYVNIGESFTVPDFLEGSNMHPEVPNEEFLGWSSNWKAEEPHYLPNMLVSNFEFERDLDTPEHIAYLYAVWRKLYMYTLTYNPNGGTGEPPVDTYGPTSDEEHNFILNTSIVPSKATYRFMGWGEAPDSTSAITNKTVTHLIPDGVVYALWQLMNLDDITLSFEYANDGKLDKKTGIETVIMKVEGQDPSYPNLERTYDCSGYKDVKEDIEKRAIYYKHQFTFNEVGIYPVVVTHNAPSVEPKTAAGVIKVMGSDGNMSGNGTMSVNKGYGSWYDSGWITTSVVFGAYISAVKFHLKFDGHGNSKKTDALAIFAKKTDGKTYTIWDLGNTEERRVNLTNLGTTAMVTDGPHGPLVFGNVTLQRADLNDVNHYVPGKSEAERMTFTKNDDIRQVRFFVFSAHDTPSCMDNAIINYDIDYEFDIDLYESDNNDPPKPEDPGESPNPGPSTDDPDPPPNPPTPSDTSEYYNISEVKDFTDQWGWDELSGNKALQELYTRIYNSYVNNGKKPIIYTSFDGSGEITQNAIFNSSEQGFDSMFNEMNGKYLCIPVEDLNLDYYDVDRVQRIVEYDCPHLLYQWKYETDGDLYDSDTGQIYFHLVPYFNESTANKMLKTMDSTFKEICGIIKQYYNIDYVEDTFYNNNRRYTKTQKKQIAKVIHDWIETHNHYGDTSMEATKPPWVDGIMLNQIAYPALSKGEYDPICASYARAFKYCCDRWGISCLIVVGHVGNERDGNHDWNMVSYEQKTPKECGMTGSYWQEVDCTHDDVSSRSLADSAASQGFTESALASICIWNHFNVPTAEINNGIYVGQIQIPGTDLAFSEHQGPSRFRDTYQKENQDSGYNPDGSQEIGTYLKYPIGTCNSNKYEGNTLYGGF